MGDVVSAGSYVGAVMELAGYRVQADILTQFQDFFREAGAFLYVLAGVGAVVSFATLGSYRAVRYLLIGPAIFWMLVTTRSPYDGTIWKIGSGTPRGLHRQRGEGASRADVTKAVRDVFGVAPGTVNVAYGFKLFAYPINNIVNGVVSILLDGDEDAEYSTFLHKGRALDAFLNVRPRVQFLLRAIDKTILNDETCATYTGFSMALGMPELHPDAIDAMANTDENAANITRARRLFYKEKIETVYGPQLFPIGDEQVRAQLGFTNPQQNSTLSCSDQWKRVFAQILREGGDANEKGEAARETDRIIGLAAMEMGGNGDQEGLACGILMKKITGTVPENCRRKLKNAVAIMMVKNILTDRQALFKFVTQMRNKRKMEAGRGTPGALQDIPIGMTRMFGGDPLVALESFQPFRYQNPDGGGVMTLRPGGTYAGDPFAGDDLAQARRARRWSGGARLTVLGGPNQATEASFVDFPRYNTRKLAQQLFTWALNAPWWQGVLLFLIAISYPFICLVTLIPGRAQSFLLLPLAWLWVKSWDIGFAMVMVLERVLWNNFPPMRMSESLINGSIANRELYEILSEAQKADPVWSLHSYFLIMSVALLSVPTVMGFVTMKSRRAILASFTDRMLQDVKSAGDLAAGQLQIQAAAGRSQFMYEIQSKAIEASRTPQAEQQRMAAAASYGAAQGFQTFQQNIMVGGRIDPTRVGYAYLMAQARMGTATNEMQQQMEAHDRAYSLMFDPMFGRFGVLGVYYDAEKAGADASGGFEMEGDYQGKDNPVGELINLQSMRVEQMFSYTNQQARTLWQNQFGRIAVMGSALDLFSQNGEMGNLTSLYNDPEIRRLDQQIQDRENELEKRRVAARLNEAGLNANDRTAWTRYRDSLPATAAVAGTDDEIRAQIQALQERRAGLWRTRNSTIGQGVSLESIGRNRWMQGLNAFLNDPANQRDALDEIVRARTEAFARSQGWGFREGNQTEWRHHSNAEGRTWYKDWQVQAIVDYERQLRANFQPGNVSSDQMLANVFGVTPGSIAGLQNPAPIIGQGPRTLGSPPVNFDARRFPDALEAGLGTTPTADPLRSLLGDMERMISPEGPSAFQRLSIPGYGSPSSRFWSPYFPNNPTDTTNFELYQDTMRRRFDLNDRGESNPPAIPFPGRR